LNHFVDAMALDAIQAGGMIAWIMELARDGLIQPEEFGFPPASEMRFNFASDTASFDLELDSRRNADYAYQALFAILFDPRSALFRRGMRAAAKELDERQMTQEEAPDAEHLSSAHHPSSRAVYTAHGAHGCMAPNQYWVPGMFSPMPMMGKYFVHYGLDFLPPRALGKKCVERMVYELFNENSGVCRFHRKWAEAIVAEIISAHYRFPVDYKAHQFELARQIYALDGQATVFWENERAVDLIWQYLEVTGRDSGFKDRELRAWVERFRVDKWDAARAYWDEMAAGIAEAFAAGPGAIKDQRASGLSRQ
jgi:glyceraldehyde-3-phosphate dehydrogenase (ferredoxin)